MKAKSPILVAVTLITAFGVSTAFADIKRITKGRSGTVIVKAEPKQNQQATTQTEQRVKTVALMPNEQKKKPRRAAAGGRGR